MAWILVLGLTSNAVAEEGEGKEPVSGGGEARPGESEKQDLAESVKKLEAKPVLGNVLITSVVWAILGRDLNELQEMVKEMMNVKPL
jgi:hypothetical protein